jgi:hypothetical protein
MLVINPNDFLVEVPKDLHPLSLDYISFWREQKRRCIEGYWVGGTWMPPALYFYVNFATIKKNPYLTSHVKIFARPDLRDIEWDFFYHYTQADGFSGFELDDNITCNRIVLEPDISIEFLLKHYPETVSSSGEIKKYMDASSYLRLTHPTSLGKPFFRNPTKNVLMLGTRNLGKSYMVGAGLVPHKFIFDGASEYSEEIILNPPSAEILVGAEVSDRSKDILKKTKECLDFLPGSSQIGERKIPSPFSKKYVGTFEVNSEVRAEYKKKVSGKWEVLGSRSAIKHRSFNENPFAAQGTRPRLLVIEEAGLCSNLKEIHANTVDNLRDGSFRTGVLMMLGTGGDMDKGTLAAAEMFYEPDRYDILATEDVYESRGKIGYFIPGYYSLKEFRDENGNVDVEKGKKFLLRKREELRGNSSSSEALNKEIQYRPIVPSEMFLSRSSTIFPTTELRARLSAVQTHKLYDLSEKKVNLYFNPQSIYNGVDYEVDSSLQAISVFPYDGDNREGCIVIYELPHLVDTRVPDELYIIGCDPFKDDSQTGASLAAVYVMKTHRYPHLGHSEIVASFVGRPYMGKNEVNEILHKLALFYNAKIYFENNVGNVKDYFEKVRRLDLLASQPVTVFNRKASYNTSNVLTYGYSMSNHKVKWEALQYLRTFLLTPREDSRLNLDFILDPALLQELIQFNMDGNFDRVMALVGCIIGLEELYNKSKIRQELQNESSELQKEFENLIVNNKRLFRNGKFSKTTHKLFAEDLV